VATVAEVLLWGRRIGAVSLEDGGRVAAFQYDPAFVASGIELSPISMPLSRQVYQFPSLPLVSFRGLPGLLADSLPDRFGNTLIDAWLATQGRGPESFNAVERLCYIGVRGMGALEYAPAKAIVAWNRDTNDVRSGQVKAPAGFDHWLLKFDGVSANKDKELEDPKGYTVIEYAYALMAADAGIDMSESRLFEENGRRHFMTRRFDRLSDGGKIHMQSLAALAHFDFNAAGAYSYEQAFDVIKRLGLPMRALDQQFRRMIFNVVARNHDDHVKNIAFLMDKEGAWTLSPAFDVTYAYNPAGAWTNRHQMTINGKADDFTRQDFKAVAQVAGLKRGSHETIRAEVIEAVKEWPRYAKAAGVPGSQRDQIMRTLRLKFD